MRDRSLQIRIPKPAYQHALTRLHQHGLKTDDPYILLNPWTSCQARTYPSERFAIAARRLSEITDYPVVVTGVAKDLQQSAPLLEVLGTYAINLIGAITLAELVALVADAKLMLSNNIRFIAKRKKNPLKRIFDTLFFLSHDSSFSSMTSQYSKILLN